MRVALDKVGHIASGAIHQLYRERINSVAKNIENALYKLV
jgi:hypothetical protein